MKGKIESIIEQLNDLLDGDNMGYVLIAYKDGESCISSINDVSSQQLTEMFYNLIRQHEKYEGGDLMYMGAMFDAALNYAQRDEKQVLMFIDAFTRWLQNVAPQNVKILVSKDEIKCEGDA